MKTITNSSLKILLATLTVVAMLLMGSSMALAHGGGTVDPTDPNCMGQLARLHANDKDPGANPDTQNGFGTNQNHGGLDGPYDSIKDQAKAFKAFCNSDL